MNLKTATIDEIQTSLQEEGYFGTKETAMAIKNAAILEKPILIEGPPGVGKTELAKVLSRLLNQEFIRLQCTPEINERKAIYEFDYAKQLLFIQMLKDSLLIGQEQTSLEEKIHTLHQNNPFYTKEFLIQRPLLKAFQSNKDQAKVLLIDELDKADEDFEYALLEAFSDYTISIPEIGTLVAEQKPLTIITSNRRRKITDTFARRCIYLYLSYPSIKEEAKIIVSKVQATEHLAETIAQKVAAIRNLKLAHTPSIAESIEWTSVLMVHLSENDESIPDQLLIDTMSVIAKTPSDREKIKKHLVS